MYYPVCLQAQAFMFMHDACVSANPNARLCYRKFSFHPHYPVKLMLVSGAHAQHNTECTGLFGLCRLIPPTYWNMDVAPPAVISRQSNSLLLNSDFKMSLKADSTSITYLEGKL